MDKIQNVPTVSIGFPVFNGEQYIEKALDSLLVQTFVDFELIISDNASQDGTEYICRRYASRDSRIRYVRQPRNLGALANFKYVLEKAVGEFFMWAAADDMWDADWIAALLPQVVSCDALVFGCLKNIGPMGESVWQSKLDLKFDFSGARLFRRISFFVAHPGRGKANPIYGLARTASMRSLDVKILGEVEYGGDMLFLYHLLFYIPIIPSTSAACLYKRVHLGCASLSDPPRVARSANLWQDKVRALLGMLFSVAEPFQRLVVYSRHSSLLESVIMVMMLPGVIAFGLIFLSRRYVASRYFA